MTKFTQTSTIFEVGKMYKHKQGVCIYEVEFITSAGYAVGVTSTDSHFSIAPGCFKYYEEVIPPPSQEWRAVYWGENGKPEISATYWATKEDVEKNEKSHTHFMYAIRTDRGVLN